MSKYANLSDIDDQPEVYETSDDVEQSEPNANHHNDDDQEQSSDDGCDENLNRTRISHKDASERFKNSLVDSYNTDFSDRLTRKKKAMYRTYARQPLDNNGYGILLKDMVLEETRLQKFRRLTFEVQELGHTLDKDKDQADLIPQITYLQNELDRLQHRIKNTNQQPSSDSTTTSFDKRIDEAKSLIKQLETYTSLTTSQIEDGAAETKDTNAVSYELYYTPETIKAQLEDVDERITRTEKLVGTASGQGFDSIPSNLTNTSLLHTLSKLEQHIVLLGQPQHLDTLDRRINVLNSELDRLHQLKPDGPDGEKELGGSSTLDGEGDASNGTEKKVIQLFATVEKVDPLLNLTPELLARLKALQGLHTEAATFEQSIKTITEDQTRMATDIKKLDTSCELLTKSLKDNEDLINRHVGVIDTQMTDLVRQMETLTAATSIS